MCTGHFYHFFFKSLNNGVFPFDLWRFVGVTHVDFHGEISGFLNLFFTIMKFLLKIRTFFSEWLILLAQLINLLGENVILILKDCQLFIRFDNFVFVLLFRNSLIHGILNNDNKSLLTSLIKAHNSLNVILLLRCLHENCNYCFKEFYRLLLGIIFCNFYQFHIIYFKKLFRFIFYVALHFGCYFF